jgi:hypothetical protein
MKVEKGTLVYVPANVRLEQGRLDGDYGIYVSDYVVTQKPVNCLVVGVKEKGHKKYKIIYEGASWYVNSNNVYEVQKENINVSEVG